MLFTGNFYKYTGHGRLDITVKSALPIDKVFTPTWDIVMGFKNDKITWQQYIDRYMSMLYTAYNNNQLRFQKLAMDANKGDIVLVCYCYNVNKCHRLLLAHFMAENFEVDYGGEI